MIHRLLAAGVLLTMVFQPVKTVWSGVYTTGQAARGKDEYETHCSSCHGAELGGMDAPPLVGEGFLRNWLEDDMRSLVDKVHTRMPGDAPGSLSYRDSTDIVSYLLEMNQFPAGSEELPENPTALAAIRIEGKTGPGPVPNFSLVRVVGCLIQTADAQWMILHGTEPSRTRESAATRQAADAPAPALGSQTFRLMDAATVRPESSSGRIVEVKGLLMRQPAGITLNVTSIQTVGPACS
jgi:cytochrome c553